MLGAGSWLTVLRPRGCEDPGVPHHWASKGAWGKGTWAAPHLEGHLRKVRVYVLHGNHIQGPVPGLTHSGVPKTEQRVVLFSRGPPAVWGLVGKKQTLAVCATLEANEGRGGYSGSRAGCGRRKDHLWEGGDKGKQLGKKRPQGEGLTWPHVRAGSNLGPLCSSGGPFPST